MPTRIALVPGGASGRCRRSVATRASSPSRPGTIAFASRPTPNDERTWTSFGWCSGGSACPTVRFHERARKSVETTFSANARMIQLQMTRLKASRTLPQSGPRHQSSVAASTKASAATPACAQPERQTLPIDVTPRGLPRRRFRSRRRIPPRAARRSQARRTARPRVPGRASPMASRRGSSVDERADGVGRAPRGRSAATETATSGVSTSR